MKIVKVKCVVRKSDAEVNVEEVKKEFEKRFSRYKGAHKAGYSTADAIIGYDWADGEIVGWVNKKGQLELETSDGTYSKFGPADFNKFKSKLDKLIAELE